MAASTDKTTKAGTVLTYTVKRGSKYETVQATFVPGGGDRYEISFEPKELFLRNPIDLLPIWLPPDQRKIGHVLYDDGRGPRMDTSQKRFALAAESTWRSFKTLITHHRHQGMQRQDAYQMKAYYDVESGFLVAAHLAEPGLERWDCTFEFVLKASSDPEIRRKAYVAESKAPTRIVIHHRSAHVGTVKFDSAHQPTLDLVKSAGDADRLERDWAEILAKPELMWKRCVMKEVDGAQVHAMIGSIVKPGDADYIYAAMEELERAGYETKLAD